jgi:hypothetical protein
MQVAPLCRVVVSGVSEGQPEHVLSSEPEAWFETDESSDPMPWIQVVLPSNVRVVHFNRWVAVAGWLRHPQRLMKRGASCSYHHFTLVVQ